MTHRHIIHGYHRQRTLIKAALFAGLLICFLITSIMLSFMSAGPLILGTELNPNGTVEYLCMGTGCENLRAMD